MNRTISTTLILTVIALATGCASSAMTMYHDAQQNKLIRIQASQGSASVGIDLAQLGTGYFSAWKDQPMMMLGATAVDVGLGYLAYEGYANMTEDDKPDQPPTVNQYNGDYTVISQQGNGNSLQYQGSMNSSSASSTTTTNAP